MRLDVFKAAGGMSLLPGRLGCSKCGAGNAGDARLCGTCGQGLYVKCVACGEENLRVRDRCRACGFYMRRTLGKRVRKWVTTKSSRWTLGLLGFLAVAYGTVRVIQLVIQLDGDG